MTETYSIKPKSAAPPPPREVASGPTTLILPVGVAGSFFAQMPPCMLDDDAILSQVRNAVQSIREGHGTVPPDDVLLAVYRYAYRTHKSPRRRKFFPQMAAQAWALHEAISVSRVWASKRPDHRGTHIQYQHIADFVNRVVYSGEAVKTPEPAPVEVEVEAAPTPPPPPPPVPEPVRPLIPVALQPMTKKVDGRTKAGRLARGLK